MGNETALYPDCGSGYVNLYVKIQRTVHGKLSVFLHVKFLSLQTIKPLRETDGSLH